MNASFDHPTPNQLFHYTDGSGLLGILESSTLWASDAELMNDSAELLFGAKLFLELLEKRLSIVESSIELERLRAEVQSQFLDRTSPNLNPEFFFYLVSFCHTSDLLSMWRGYSASGGFCIEFDKSILLESIRCNEHLEVDLLAVRYGQDAVVILERELDEFLTQTHTDTRSFVWNLTKIFAGVKDEAFQEEQEYRLIARAPACYGPRPEIRVGSRHLLNYRELSFTREAIRSVTVGPGPYQLQSVLALKRRQIPNPADRFHPQILASSIPLRV